jgi:DNA-binding transcriptional LysR family regulator
MHLRHEAPACRETAALINGPALLGFITVAEVGSVHAAARRLNISQTALTRRLQRLEAELGTPLFVRSGQRLSLSAHGTRLFARTRPHLEGLLSAVREMKEEARSGKASVSFGCLPSVSRILLPEVVGGFLRKRPETRLKVYDSSADEVIGRVIDKSADFGVSLLGMVPSELSQEYLGEDPLVLFVHCDHPLAQREWVAWSDLVGERLIAGGGPSGNRSLVESVRAHIGIELEWRHEVQHIPTAIEWTGAGVAHTIAPRLIVGDRTPENVRSVEIRSPQISRAIGILCRAGEKLSPDADMLKRMIAAMLRRTLAQGRDDSAKPTPSIHVTLGESAAKF